MTSFPSSVTSLSKTRLQVEKTPYVDEDAPAGIVGAEFFGGNKQKVEFFDPVAEADAAVLAGLAPSSTGTLVTASESTSTTAAAAAGIVDRFVLPGAFISGQTTTIEVARDMQSQINAILYDKPKSTRYQYSTKLDWKTPFVASASSTTKTSTTTNPLVALNESLRFYRRIDVAITSGRQLDSNRHQLRFEIAVTWPTVWEPSVVLTGTSTVTLKDDEIVQQVDELDDGDLLSLVARQVAPRFWDLYHLGMSVSSENTPQLPAGRATRKRSPFATYKLRHVPPRLYLQPTLLDPPTNRDSNNAAFIPNHAYTTAVITMGPLKQRYSATSPVMVQISSTTDNNRKLSWDIPLPVEYMSNTDLRLPAPADSVDQACVYTWRPRRLIATLPYRGGSGSPQDEAVVRVRKDLYEQVVQRDGHKPMLDESGRPVFYFLQHNIKMCFTEDGFGMTIYDWRPRFADCYEIGLELLDREAVVQGLEASDRIDS